ncbi:hypothetical protein [Nitrosopumilus sp.]|uniref:hypothetical protein n=1 Tax=Nitrosopumilus sp. TaxID=2024843 RepID=UPI0026204532|nr:hypothetical protein [Nitrosopumilus sp.]
MISNKPLNVEEPKWDRCTRNGFLRVGNKRVPFHTLAPLITSYDYDFIPYFDNLKQHPSESTHARMMTFRMFELHNTLKPLLQSIYQTTLDGKLAYDFEKDVIETTPILIDPCMEYTWYSQYRKILSTNKDTPIEVRKLAKRILAIVTKVEKGELTKSEGYVKEKIEYEKFWLGLAKDKRKLSDVVTKILDLQNSMRADIGLPPVPAVYSPELLEVTKQINKIAQAVWVGENCATYVVLTPQWLKSEALVDLLIDYLKSVDSKFIVLKIKNLELDKVTYVYQRRMFKKILEAVNVVKQNDEEKVFMLLEAGYQMYPAITGGFDFVSTSLRALDKDGGGFSPDSEGYGGFFSPKHLVVLPWRDVKIMFANGGLKCSCEICRGITSIPSKDEWNVLRRMHYMLVVSRMLEDVNKFVLDQKIELAIEKLSLSELSNFKRMLPYIS